MAQSDSTAWRLFLTVAVILLVNVSLFGPGADPMSRNMAELTLSIVDEHNLNVDEFTNSMGLTESEELTDKAPHDGHLYNGAPPGASFLMVPVYALLKPVVWLMPKGVGGLNAHQLGFVLLMLVSGALVCVFSAVLVTAVYRLARGVGAGKDIAVTAALALVPGSWFLFYGTHVSSKTIAVGLTVLAFVLCVRASGVSPRGFARGVFTGETQTRPKLRPLLAGVLLGTAVSVDYGTSLLALAILAVYLGTRVGARSLLWLGLGLAVPLALTGAYHTAAFGGPLVHSYVFRLPDATPSPASSWPTLERTYGLLVSPHKGLLFYAPWVVLSVVGCVHGLRSRFRAEVLTATVIVVLTVLSNLFIDIWTGLGWGPRYLTLAVPFLAWMLAFVPRRWRVFLWVLLAWATAVNLLPVLHGGLVVGERLWDNPMTLYGRAILETGAATYTLRFFSRNVRELTPATLTALQALLTMLTALSVWVIWRKRTREIGTAEVR